MTASLLALALVAAPPGAERAVITLEERVPAVMLVISPRDASPHAPTSALLDAADRALRARTRLALRSAEQAGSDVSRLARCDAEERMTCWLSIVRPDVLGVHADGAPPRPAEAARYVLVLAVHPTANEADRISLLMIDADEARARLEVLEGDADRRERAENEIFAASRQAPPAVVTGGDARAYFDAAIEGQFRALLADNGDFEPYGRVVIRAPAGLAVQVDTIAAGTTAAETELRDVTPGRRTITLTSADGAASAIVEVTRAKTATVTFDALFAQPQSAPLRSAMLYGGAALAVAGGVLAILAVERGGLREGCLTRGTGTCEGLGLASFGFDRDAAPTADRTRVEPGGVRILPLGLALLGAGGITAGGALVLEDDTSAWLPLVLGLAAGAVTYGAATALGGG